MAAYLDKRKSARHSLASRVTLLAVLLALPAVIAVLFALHSAGVSLATSISAIFALTFYVVSLVFFILDAVTRPLQTMSNVVAAMREGDYSFRARGTRSQDAMGELASEVNALADLLQRQRIRSLEATALLSRIVEVMNAPLLAFDLDGVLRLINPAGEQLLSRPPARCLGRTASELDLQSLIDAPDESIRIYGSHLRRWMVHTSVFRQDGVPHRLLLLTDVSQPLQDEERLAWQRLIRVLGHELSNSLAPIKSIAGSLISRIDSLDLTPELNGAFYRGLNVIESRAESLHRFVEAYRQLAQLPAPHLTTVELAPLIERVAMLEHRVDMHLQPGPQATLLADADQLEQMLINLLRNAAEASLDNQSTEVVLRWTLTPHVLHSEGVSARTVTILIEDRGMGIANADNLFVPFYTTREGGSGIGLALAQQIAHAHGGDIALENRQDVSGARAIVRLPIPALERSRS